MEVSTYIELRDGGRRDLPRKQLYMLDGQPGVWEYRIDVKSELGIEGARAFEESSRTGNMKIMATFRDGMGNHAEAELLLLPHHSPTDQHVKVFTSTINPRVNFIICII